ncbi:hypothetical protein QBC45DRAFT_417646 [Copromyces sp. CBS 386.78]|nr:hypothetical protein QBC45DRAFT_417646 [Copromyces sp. CBS 386.78]
MGSTAPPVEDEDEWEYEYSTTETETYYLTLDLSVRDFLEKHPDDIVNATRNGYRIWYNPLFNTSEPRPMNPDLIAELQGPDDEDEPGKDMPNLDNAGAENTTVENAATSIAQSTVPSTAVQNTDPKTDDVIDPALRGPAENNNPKPVETNKQPVNTEKPNPTAKTPHQIDTIQILDLHSKEPMVSYRNHIFQGAWSENIGTEMIFTPHDPDSPLPALRNLSETGNHGKLDLLAASATRINFKEVRLESKQLAEQNSNNLTKQISSITAWGNDDIPERYKRADGVYVHIGGDKTGQRQPQAHFLEDLIMLKRKLGETDSVTIRPLETRQNKLMMEDEGEERRRKRLKNGHGRYERWRQGLLRKDRESRESGEEGYIPRTEPPGQSGQKKGKHLVVKHLGVMEKRARKPRSRKAILRPLESQETLPAHPVDPGILVGGDTRQPQDSSTSLYPPVPQTSWAPNPAEYATGNGEGSNGAGGEA